VVGRADQAVAGSRNGRQADSRQAVTRHPGVQAELYRRQRTRQAGRHGRQGRTAGRTQGAAGEVSSGSRMARQKQAVAGRPGTVNGSEPEPEFRREAGKSGIYEGIVVVIGKTRGQRQVSR